MEKRSAHFLDGLSHSCEFSVAPHYRALGNASLETSHN